MSYDRVNPTYYQTFQPDTPFHAGSQGWTKAPWPTWGDNPNLAGRQRLATDGLGSVVAISGLGATVTASVPPMPNVPPVLYNTGGPRLPNGESLFPEIPAWRKALDAVSGAACAYHGYKRNDSAKWAVLWAFFGTAMPFLALPIALAQGFGKPERAAAMAANPRRRRRARR